MMLVINKHLKHVYRGEEASVNVSNQTPLVIIQENLPLHTIINSEWRETLIMQFSCDSCEKLTVLTVWPCIK